MKIEIGTQVVSKRNGNGVISKIITKSTGYVEVNYNGSLKKEMAFNLTSLMGESLKAKPVIKAMTAEQSAKADRVISELNLSILKGDYFENQIQNFKSKGLINSKNEFVK